MDHSELEQARDIIGRTRHQGIKLFNSRLMTVRIHINASEGEIGRVVVRVDRDRTRQGLLGGDVILLRRVNFGCDNVQTGSLWVTRNGIRDALFSGGELLCGDVQICQFFDSGKKVRRQLEHLFKPLAGRVTFSLFDEQLTQCEMGLGILREQFRHVLTNPDGGTDLIGSTIGPG
jgi:hypothetical protein